MEFGVIALLDELAKVIEFHKTGLSDARVDSIVLLKQNVSWSARERMLDIYQRNFSEIVSTLSSIQKGELHDEVKKLPGKFAEIRSD
jgi:hypothetical protein